MILVDTSVWSGHLRARAPHLVDLLEAREVASHPWIVGELALGPGIRGPTVDDLLALPQLPVVSDPELLRFVRLHALRGVGWVDAQLLLAALTARTPLWTFDRTLAELAARFDIAVR